MKAKEKKSQIMDDVEEIDAKGSTKGSDKATAKDAKKDSAKGRTAGAEQITVLEGRDAVRKRPRCTSARTASWAASPGL